MASNPLARYRSKRDFEQTPEPAARKGATHQRPRFVVQKHEARTLHYDFRLEVDGVLKSWSVPKGPSLNPSERRLAVQTEDHPLVYARFEGAIPAGQYGGGTVMIWDRGTYRSLRKEQDMASALRNGLLEFWLNGKRLRGGYVLKRIRAGAKPQWLLIKKSDQGADARRDPLRRATRSIVTRRSMREIAAGAAQR